MVYSKKFVGVVKVKGKILREHDNVVTIPFGEEYSILLKNLNSVKAVVTISIDGQDVLDGKSIIVDPNQSSEIEGFLRGNSVSNKFKFIQKTKEIQNYRGDKIDDGIIRIEYKFEKIVDKRTVIVEHHHHDWYHPWNYPWYCHPYSHTITICDVPKTYTNGSINNVSSGVSVGSANGSSCDFTTMSSNENCSYTANSLNVAPNNNDAVNIFNSQPLQDEGITVKGSQSNQSFKYDCVGQLEEFSSVITLKLRGTTSKGIEVKEPLIVTKKIKCNTCGKVSKSSSKFCRNCGTSLI